MICEYARDSHGTSVKKTLLTHCRKGGMTVNQLNTFPCVNIEIKRQGEPEGRVSSLKGHVCVWQVINFNVSWEVTNSLPISVRVGEDDNSMTEGC